MAYALKHRMVKLQLPEREVINEFIPIDSFNEIGCIAVSQNGSLYRINLTACSVEKIMNLQQVPIDWNESISLHISSDNKIAAIVNTYGLHGVVVDLEQGRILMEFVRGGYHCNHCIYPLAFIERNNQTYLIHATDWNRLDITDPRTGEVITDRRSPVYSIGKSEEHYMDYFHSNISVSPDHKWIVDNGWRWHPFGDFTTFSIDQWLTNVWESEDGTSKKSLWWGMDGWNNAIRWLDNSTVAILGKYEYDFHDEEEIIMDAYVDTVRIFNVESGKQIKCIDGPTGQLVFDELLYAYSEDEGFSAWNIESEEMVLHVADFCPKLYHPSAKRFLTLLADNSFQITEVQS
ncbi:MAG: hypothetical protein JWM44_1900 [Bacilli bacterium]|nr:hypothetical protein [Bacilli bacterium]